MKVGVFYPDFIPHSAGYYAEYIRAESSAAGVEYTEYSSRDPLPADVDLYWDFRSLGGNPPHHSLRKATKPVVVTVHGAAPFAMSGKDLYTSFRRRLKRRVTNYRKLRDWRAFNDGVAAIITVSNFAKEEIEDCLNLKNHLIIPIYHGVDHEVFKPGENDSEEKPYLLHVSHYQPLKNVERIISAYRDIHIADKPELVLIVPGYVGNLFETDVRLITTSQSPLELAKYYQGAMGFVFPSLRESFGMPILEAMACGCPVITSNFSGCKEIAGNAALLVDPYSIKEIQGAILTLIESSDKRIDLRTRGLERAGMFSWKVCAKEHLKVFSMAIENAD